MKIKFITDSSSDISEELVLKNDITVLPMKIIFEDGMYTDGVDLSKEEFYKKLALCKTLPKTSQVNEYDFSCCYEKNIDNYDAIIVIAMSGILSGTYNSAVKAKENGNYKNVYVIDGKTITFCLGAIVLESVKLARKIDDIDTLLSQINILVESARLVSVVDTLKYLQAGGRLSAGGAIIGTLLNVKPIVETIDGEVKATNKVIGLKKGFTYIAKELKKRDKNYPVYFGNGDAPETMRELIAVCRKFNDEFEIGDEASIGCTVGTHAGNNCTGAVFFQRKK